MNTYAIAKCVGCGAIRAIHAGEIAPGDHPMCDCGMPMVAWKGKYHADESGDAYEERTIEERKAK